MYILICLSVRPFVFISLRPSVFMSICFDIRSLSSSWHLSKCFIRKEIALILGCSISIITIIATCVSGVRNLFPGPFLSRRSFKPSTLWSQKGFVIPDGYNFICEIYIELICLFRKQTDRPTIQQTIHEGSGEGTLPIKGQHLKSSILGPNLLRCPYTISVFWILISFIPAT